MRSRDIHQDILKGFAIILVVYGHMARGLMDAHSPDTVILKHVDFIIYTTHMPLFFFIAGYNAVQSLDRRETAVYLRSRWAALIYPYLVWSAILWAAKIAAQSFAAVNHPVAIADLLSIAWQPISPYWFIYALLLMQLFMIAFRERPLLLVSVAVAGSASVTVFQPKSLSAVLGSMSTHMPFFALGVWLASKRRPLIPEFMDRDGAAAVALVAFAGGVLFFAVAFPSVKPVGIWTLPVSLAGLGVLMALAHEIPTGALQDRLAYIGRLSFSIFLIHIIFTAQMRVLTAWLDIHNIAVVLLVGTLAGVLLPILLHEISLRAGLARWLGLATSARQPGS